MITCRLPVLELSPGARAYRQLWADRWPWWGPLYGGDTADGVMSVHRDAYPMFRSPLSAEEEQQVSVELFREAITALAGDEPVVLLTVDSEWTNDGESGSDSFDAVPGLSREYWFSWTDPEDGDDLSTIINHGYRSERAPDDPLLEAAMVAAANGDLFTVTSRDLSWVMRVHEERVTLASSEPANLTILEAVYQSVQRRWDLDRDRQPFIDLRAVLDAFEARREVWAARGVQVITEPQYRIMLDKELAVIDALPDDPAAADWMYFQLGSIATEMDADTTVVVHDTGTCTVHFRFERDDDGSEDRDNAGEWDETYEDSLRQWPQHEGSLDLAGVLTVIDDAAAAITPTKDGRYRGVIGPRNSTQQHN